MFELAHVAEPPTIRDHVITQYLYCSHDTSNMFWRGVYILLLCLAWKRSFAARPSKTYFESEPFWPKTFQVSTHVLQQTEKFCRSWTHLNYSNNVVSSNSFSLKFKSHVSRNGAVHSTAVFSLSGLKKLGSYFYTSDFTTACSFPSPDFNRTISEIEKLWDCVLSAYSSLTYWHTFQPHSQSHRKKNCFTFMPIL